MKNDTIFALATAHGRAGVAVIRISGPDARVSVQGILSSFPDGRDRFVAKLLDEKGQTVDIAMVLYFLEGKSFTGEEVIELHLHGSIAVQNAVLRMLADLPNLRMAEPGEFTRRALENDRLDLAQVEGLSDLIDADTEAQRKQAMLAFGGALSDFTKDIRTKALHALALIEASIDFADEEVPEDVSVEVAEILHALGKTVSDLLARSDQAEAVRNGFQVAILGQPNAGKSTLLNYIAGRDVAITSDIAGTTRDVLEVKVDLNGLPVTFLDTAGLREGADTLETRGIELAKKRANSADLRLFLDDIDDAWAELEQHGDIRARSKADLTDSSEFAVSGKTGQGVRELLDKIQGNLSQRVPKDIVAVRARQRDAFAAALDNFRIASETLKFGFSRYELVAEHLHQAISALDMMLGKIDVEEILGEIFSRFCVGK